MPALETSWQRCTGAALSVQLRTVINEMINQPKG
jgi:hypothetical protein